MLIINKLSFLALIKNMYDLIIIGGGPAAVFAAVVFKFNNPNKNVLILEKSSTLLSKLLISGGGRCNITNINLDLNELSNYYPRGFKELRSALLKFGPKDLIEWFEKRKVFFKEEENGKIFPKSDDSETIANILKDDLKKLGCDVLFDVDVLSIKKEEDFELAVQNEMFYSKNILIATGSSKSGYVLAKSLKHSIIDPIPSLFSFKIKDFKLQNLAGISKKAVFVKIKETKFSYYGDILITKVGFSGPSIIYLSSYAAKFLKSANYKAELLIDWINSFSNEKAYSTLLKLKKDSPLKYLHNENPFDISKNLWKYFLDCFDIKKSLKDISNKSFLSLIDKLKNDSYNIDGRGAFGDEFVTCGGVNLKEIDFKTMESKLIKNLYFAGEILDIDGITGGFNLQSCWTTAYIAAQSII